MSKKVLIIEDDEQISHVYTVNFKRSGIESSVEIDGEAGLNRALTEQPGVILLDLMLQGKDGFWFLEERKKNADLMKIPVIVLSNLGQEQDKKRATELGATVYMVKADVPIKTVIDEAMKYLV